jgi:hypothetical protein
LHQCKRQCLHRAKSARRPLSEDYRSTSVAAVAIGTSTTEHITKPAKRASLSPSSLDSRSPALLLPRSPEISVNDKIRATGRMLTFPCRIGGGIAFARGPSHAGVRRHRTEVDDVLSFSGGT